MKTLKIRLIDANINISLSDPGFYSYLRSILEDHVRSFGDSADLDSRFEWHKELIRKNPLKLDADKGYDNIGPNISISQDKKEISFLKKIHGRRLKCGARLANKRIEQVLFCHKKMLKDLCLCVKNRSPHLDFFEISYFLLYYPLFWFLENFRGIFPMHGSCVDTPLGGVVLTGLPGSGKTVTSLALWSKEKHNKLLSDNIVLYDNEKFYACPEPVRLHDEGKRLVGDDNLERIDTPSGKPGKGFYKIKGAAAESLNPRVFLFVKLSDRYNLEEMDHDAAASLAFSQNLQGAELLNYFEYASLLGFLNMKKDLFSERLMVLRYMLKKMRCYMISVPRNKPVDAVCGSIMELLK